MSRVKAGEAYVEIGGDPRKLFATLNRVTRQIGQMGSAFSSIGSRMAGAGAALAAPMGVAVAAGARFQDVMLGIQASTGTTGAQLDKVRAAALDMSKSLGVGPKEAASGMLELMKAGMSVETVLGGAGTAALQFAKVGQMDVATAAVTMSDAMNVFGVSADKAANTLTAAADSSSTSVGLIVEAFSNVGAVGKDANQSIDELSAAIAILGNNMVKGGDAGTALKTMMLRLTTGADSAAEGLASVGLSTESFRNAAGQFMPLGQAMDMLRDKLAGLSEGDKAQALYKIFGTYGLKAATILMKEGAAGFDRMKDAMNGATPVSEKYAQAQSGLSGAMSRLLGSLERLAIAITDAVGPAIMSMAETIGPVIDGFSKFVAANKELVGQIAKGIVIFTLAGAGLYVFGKALSLTSSSVGGLLYAFKTIGAVVGGVLSPFGLIVAAIVGAGVAIYAFRKDIAEVFAGLGEMFPGVGAAVSNAVKGMMAYFGELLGIAKQTFGGIYDAIANGDLAGAMDVLWAGLKAGWLRGIESIIVAWHNGVGEIKKAFVELGSAWDKYVTKPASMFGIRVAEAAQERGVLGKFDTTRGTVFDNEEKKQARGRRKVAEDLLASGTAEDFNKNKAAAQAMIANRQAVVDAGNAPGATEEQKKAAEEAVKEIEAFRDAINMVRARMAQLGIKTEEERKAEVERRRSEIDAATQAAIESTRQNTKDASADLGNKSRDQGMTRTLRGQADDAIASLSSANTQDAVRELADEFFTLAATGKLTQEQMKKWGDAVETAQDRIETARGEAGVSGVPSESPAKVDPEALKQAAIDAAAQQSEVAGTFSAQAVTGMGFGGSLQERIAKASEDTAKGVKQLVEEGGGRAAA